MKDYPRLSEMGIIHPDQIDKFMVNSISNCDVLRIIYSRRKGSLLPISRTYKFPRVQKYITEDNGKRQTSVMETNPELRSAIDELEDLLSVNEQKQDLTESILEQLELLEEDIAMRSESIKDLLKQS
jgi:hypothetical protein